MPIAQAEIYYDGKEVKVDSITQKKYAINTSDYSFKPNNLVFNSDGRLIVSSDFGEEKGEKSADEVSKNGGGGSRPSGGGEWYEDKKNKEDTPLDKLARAVAIAETSNCTKGYALSHNNCHGIKKGNTYPCKLKAGSKSRMCNFSTKEESFVAFKVIWAKWYKNHVPTKANAIRWTGNDRADTWLKHVKANL